VNDLDTPLERALGRVLRAGSLLSAVLLGLGLLLALAGSADATATAVRDRMLSTGLIVLMGTPIVRVVVSVVGYLQQRDWVFATLTFMVLALLGASIAAAVSQ
jgi:uncharacterized membrane protein